MVKVLKKKPMEMYRVSGADGLFYCLRRAEHVPLTLLFSAGFRNHYSQRSRRNIAWRKGSIGLLPLEGFAWLKRKLGPWSPSSSWR